MRRITIIDYGMGNLRSAANAFAFIGAETTVVDDPAALQDAEAIVLPGVGAFGDGMENLRQRGFVDSLREEVIVRKKPFLGICLGMQMLATVGLEHGQHEGLGWIRGRADRLDPNGLRVPHIGWNAIHPIARTESPLLAGISKPTAFYFVHSYHLVPEDPSVVTSTCSYGNEFVATVQVKNIFGTQFHPEKSHRAGIQLLRNFCEVPAR